MTGTTIHGATYDFDGLTAVVTGGASGIGASTVRRLAGGGATVVVADVNEDGGEAVVQAVREMGGEARFESLDVTEFEAVDALLGEVADDSGLDLLVNNAGVVQVAPLSETTPDDRDRVVGVNFGGVWNGCRAALPRMAERGTGSVVNVASTGGLRGSPGLATYSATKAAVVNFTRALAGEVGPAGVRVNAVAPGTIDTEMARAVMARQDDPQTARERAATGHALKRLGKPEEVAAAICWLASDEASFVSGHCLAVDAGQSAVLRYRE